MTSLPQCNLLHVFRPLQLLWICVTLPLIILYSPLRATEAKSFYVNYSASVPTAPLQISPLAIVHPDAEIDLPTAHASGTEVLAYLSVGEIAVDAPYRDQALQAGLRTRGINPIWKSDYLDLTDTRWADLIIDKLAAEAVAKGFDGFFLDTLDSVLLTSKDASTDSPALQNALIDLIKRLRSTYPEKKIIINRGLFAFEALSSSIDGVLVESLYSTWDFDAEINKPVPPEETAALLDKLRVVTASGREVYVIDYASPQDQAGAIRTADQIQAHGFYAFVTTPVLSGEMLAPIRKLPRRVCSFYGNLEEDPYDRVDWPTDSFTAKTFQTPLEWLGYEVDYYHVKTAADFPSLGDDYRAIILPRNWQIPTGLEKAFLDWLIAQKNTGKKILIFGSIPFRDVQQRMRFLSSFGMTGIGDVVDAAQSVSFVHRDEPALAYETEIPPLAPSHRDLQAPPHANIILGLEANAPDGQTVRFDAIFSSDWGGLSLDPYTLFMRVDNTQLWNLDPFLFLRRALDIPANPVPDTTTRDGRRMFLSHIDGDGFMNGNWVEPGRFSSEVVLDRILKRYPLPVTVSVIESEVRGLVTGVDESNVPRFINIARDIFQLPNVETASHSYSHPFYWIDNDPTKVIYDRQYLPLKNPYPGIDYRREIDGSVRYINENLAPPDKPVKVFLWSGNCRPPPEALARVRELGLVNVNGGDTIISQRKPTITAVAPRTMPWADELQIFAPNQNENVYTNNWEGPLFGTFIHVIDTFKRTESPRRLKPVNVYYHFYSADFPASLRALEKIHDWVMTQPLHSITVSEYAHIALDARRTKIYQAAPEKWIIVSKGDSRTLRFSSEQAARISMTESIGVTGWEIKDDIAYVHTDGSPVVTLALSAKPIPTQARLVSSTAEIAFTHLTDELIEFTCQDLREIKVSFAGLVPGRQFKQETNNVITHVSADAKGRLALRLPQKSSVRLQFEPR